MNSNTVLRATTVMAALSTLLAAAWDQVAFGAAGDLDPAFADHGRFVPAADFSGQAHSIAPQGDTGYIFSGGELLRSIDASMIRGFVGRLGETGTVDANFEPAGGMEVFDVVIQSDGKVIGVGRDGSGGFSGRPFVTHAIAFRLGPDGVRDAGFGTGGEGLVDLPANAATSVALAPDGSIAIAGYRGSDLVVVRLLASSALDSSFAASGTFTGAGIGSAHTSLLRTDAGGYRVLTADPSSGISRCRVLALTATGDIDEAFGVLGYAELGTPASASVTCRSMARLQDGRLVVVGLEDGHALVARLTANGDVDSGFDATGLVASIKDATAVAVDDGNGIVVTGSGPAGVAGALVARLHPDGSLDPEFGNGGTTWIDLPSDAGGVAIANDVAILPSAKILVAGGAWPVFSGWRPFVARLLGNSDEDGPGVLGIMRPQIEAAEDQPEVSVIVRRMGGSAGAVAVSYRTLSPEADLPAATAGEDFIPVFGQLQWADGDVSDREIRISILPDAGVPEERETFLLELDDAAGGAGLGTSTTTFEIAADGAPGGLFAIVDYNAAVTEGSGYAQVVVQRNYYSSGAVTVTLTPVSGTAVAGEDFRAEPVTLTWGDGETDGKLVDIPVEGDTIVEQTEHFTVELSNATGGAAIGPNSTMTMTIGDDDATTPDPPPDDDPPGSTGGGGQFGWLSILLLGVSRIARAAYGPRTGNSG
jgi:uncharacterized delta-60 repeat protein